MESSYGDGAAGPHNTAYVIHTSGSTGKPKAIPITHGQYCSGAFDRVKNMRDLNSPRVLQFSSYAFDVAMEDILSGLMVGACICIPSERMRLSIPNLVGFMNKAQVNVAQWTPSFAQLINPKDVPSLKVLNLGGEALNSLSIRTWADKVRLSNIFGPTEASGEIFILPIVFLSLSDIAVI
jgi:non-ribosomal peptide synthetase component F